MITYALTMMKALASRFLSEEDGQDTMEYVLIIGAVSVAIIVAVATPIGSSLIHSIVTGTCAAVHSVMATANCS